MKPHTKIILFIALSMFSIGCDRVTKDLAKEHLANRETISYLHDTFRLQYAENTGAALNLGDGLSNKASFWLLSILPLVFLMLLLTYSIRNASKLNALQIFSLALIFSGGIGNIIDRVLYDRHVADFMNLGINNWRTGIFNVADMCVTTGVLALLFSSLAKKDKHINPVN
ncbi:MAG: signal peptidase II [Flavisolibacter sp.]